MQTAHHRHHPHHRQLHSLSGLNFPYNLNLALTPPLCHDYSLMFNSDHSANDYYHAVVKPTSNTADKLGSSLGTTDEEETNDDECSPLTGGHSSPSHGGSTAVVYPECAAMMPALTCHRKHYQPINHGINVYSKPFTIEAILGLEKKMMANPGHQINTNINFGKNNNGGKGNSGSERQGTENKHFAFKRKGKEFRCLNVKLSDKVTKSKRVRTIFTPEQLERLENEFERQQYMVGPERLYLASSLNLTEAQVKVWFQNRRIKWRKHHLEIQQAKLAKIRETDGDKQYRETSDLMPLEERMGADDELSEDDDEMDN